MNLRRKSDRTLGLESASQCGVGLNTALASILLFSLPKVTPLVLICFPFSLLHSLSFYAVLSRQQQSSLLSNVLLENIARFMHIAVCMILGMYVLNLVLLLMFDFVQTR